MLLHLGKMRVVSRQETAGAYFNLDLPGLLPNLFDVFVVFPSFQGHVLILSLQIFKGLLACMASLFGMSLGSLEFHLSIQKLIFYALQ